MALPRKVFDQQLLAL